MGKILVTGATGFVGYHVAKNLIDKNAGEVFCLVRANSEKKYVSQLKATCVEGDLRDRASLDAAMKGSEMLFHVAADYRLWAKNPQELIQSNVDGTRNILESAAAAGIKKIVYTSSVSAVGRPACAPGREHGEGDETMDPTQEQLIGPYKQSKYLAELEVRKFVKKGLPVIVVNPSTPMGTHDIKPTPTGKMVLDFLNGKMPAYLDTGLNLADVEDVAEGHWLALEKGKIGERYILGNKNLMLKEILEILAKIVGKPAPKIKIPYWIAYAAGFCSTGWAEITGNPPEIPLDGVKMAGELMFYNAGKAVRELGLPQTSVESALEKAVKFFRDNGYVR